MGIQRSRADPRQRVHGGIGCGDWKKPRPPENISPDGQAPRRFVDAEQEYLAALGSRPNKARFARTEFNQLDKAKLRQVMYGEQRSICVYCERRLSEGVHRHPTWSTGAP